MNPIYIHTADDARAIDYNTIHDIGIPSLVLMEHAAARCTDIILENSAQDDKIYIICGFGNNGADGMAIARLLRQAGREPIVAAPDIEKMSPDQKIQYGIIQKLNIPILDFESCLSMVNEADVIVDCLFGNGLNREIKGSFLEMIDAINQTDALKIAVDLPSGLHATSGQSMPECVHADITVALDCIKTGHLIKDGRNYCGKLIPVDIGIPGDMHENYSPSYLITKELVHQMLPKRSNHSHKGTFGKALMIGGSTSMQGALTMAAKACYKSGIGTLTLFIPECIYPVIASKIDFAMAITAPSENGYFAMEASRILKNVIQNYDVITIGNGIGRNEAAVELVKVCLQSDKPIIIDADACWALGKIPSLLKRETAAILTPHLREMSYITGKTTDQYKNDPFDCANEFLKMYPECTVILKSDISIIFSKDGTYVLDHPNSALAKGGSGDVLAGIVTGMFGQCRNPIQSAAVAAAIHSYCADHAKDAASLMPEDLIDSIGDTIKDIRKEGAK